jgi:hypothetical protein
MIGDLVGANPALASLFWNEQMNLLIPDEIEIMLSPVPVSWVISPEVETDSV